MRENAGVEQKADVLGLAVHSAQQEAEIKNAAIRQAERQQKYAAWADPEGMKYRKALHEKGALESLWAIRATGQCVIPFPIPPESELPKECRGQQPSTIRKMLWDYPEWREKMDAHAKVAQGGQDDKAQLMEKFPELYGIDYSALRKSLDVKFGKEHEVKTGHQIKMRESGPVPRYIADFVAGGEKEKPGLVSSIFAGIWKR